MPLLTLDRNWDQNRIRQEIDAFVIRNMTSTVEFGYGIRPDTVTGYGEEFITTETAQFLLRQPETEQPLIYQYPDGRYVLLVPNIISVETETYVENIQFFVNLNISQPVTTGIQFVVNLNIGIKPAVDVATIITDSILSDMIPRFDTYYDQFRVGKTLLNLLDDRQEIVVNWQERPDNNIALKLLNPLPAEYSVNDSAFISREVESTFLDRIRLLPLDVELIPELRPATAIVKNNTIKTSGTLRELITEIAGVAQSGSGKTYVTNGILEAYYNQQRTGLDINPDYSNFSNFIVYGSAEKRIDVFYAKLQEIEKLISYAPTNEIALNLSASVDYSGSYNTVFGTLTVDASGSATLLPPNTGLTYSVSSSVLDHINTSIAISKNIQELIRTFDDYEATLWFKSNLPYSASDATNYDESTDYLADFTYPKILGIPYATTEASALSWYGSMNTFATEYDGFNRNRLRYNVPNYLQDDGESTALLDFLDVVGHHFDNTKLYIDSLKYINSRYPKVDEELSGQAAKYVLQSFGVSIPTVNSIEKLVRYVTGDNTGSATFKDISDEYYKRYLHALPQLLKTKGTKKSVESILNVIGLNPDFITIKETVNNEVKSTEFYKIDSVEENYSLNLNSGSYIRIPLATSARNYNTIQLRFAADDTKDQTLLKFDNNFRLDLRQHPSASTNDYYSTYGRIELSYLQSLPNTHVQLATSSYFDLFDGKDISTQIQYDAAGAKLDIIKIDDGEIVFSQSLVESGSTLLYQNWNTTDNLFIGAPPTSASLGTISSSLDEFRLWGELITYDKFLQFAENPGMYSGLNYSSSLQSLLVRLSFYNPTDISSSGYILNTSPYISKSFAPDLTYITSSGFSSGVAPYYQTSRNSRKIIETSYKYGSEIQTTDMIRIAPPAYTGSNIPTLSSTNTLNRYENKLISGSVGSTRLDISISPIDTVDREVIRSLGILDLDNYIGLNLDRFNYRYPRLDALNELFKEHHVPVVDYNKFIKFFDKFLHLFYESVKEYLPARARTSTGIVIRSNLLDRNKIVSRQNIKVDGETTRRTENAIESFDRDVVRSVDTTILVNPILDESIQSDYSSIDSNVRLPSYAADVSGDPLISSNSDLDRLAAINMDSSNIVVATPDIFSLAIPSINDIQSTTSDVISGYTQTGFDSYYAVVSRGKEQEVSATLQPEYKPISDTFDLEALTYFANPNGFGYIDAIRYLPVTQSYMPQQPTVTTWSSGTSYRLGDVVVQPIGTLDSSGREYSQNGKYFVFINQGYPENPYVQSVNVPQIDAKNWTRLRYKPEVYQKVIRYAYVGGDSGSVSILTNIAASYDSLPKEYDRRHFRFHRDNSIGGRRRTYLGTLNTIDTTSDAKPPYETFDIDVNAIEVVI